MRTPPASWRRWTGRRIPPTHLGGAPGAQGSQVACLGTWLRYTYTSPRRGADGYSWLAAPLARCGLGAPSLRWTASRRTARYATSADVSVAPSKASTRPGAYPILGVAQLRASAVAPKPITATRSVVATLRQPTAQGSTLFPSRIVAQA